MAATRFFAEFGDIEGNLFTINIIDDEYSGSSPFEFIVEKGFEISYKGDVNDPFQSIIPSTCSFTMYIQNSNHEWLLDQLSSSKEGRFTLQVLDSSDDLVWNGTILADQIEIEDIAFPQACRMMASDDLGVLKDIPFKTTSGVGYGGRAALNSHLWQALSKVRWWSNLDYNSPMIKWSNNIAAAETISSTIDQLSNLAIHHHTWYDIQEGEVVDFASAYEVVDSIAKAFNARVFQYQGIFFFVPVGIYSEFTSSVYSGDFYSVDGYGNVSASSSSIDLILNDGSDFERLAGNQISYLPSFRRVEKKWDTRGVTYGIYITQHLNPTGLQNGFETIDDGGLFYPSDSIINLGYHCRYSPDLDSSVVDEGVPFIKFRIKCGDQYLSNSVSASGATYNISSASWGGTLGYYYAPLTYQFSPAVSFVSSATEAPFYSVSREFELPALPSDQDGLEILPEIIGYQTDISTSLDNFSNSNASVQLRFGTWLDQAEIGEASSLEYYSEIDEDSGEQIYSQDLKIGSSGVAGTFGQILHNASGDADPINSFKVLSNSSISNGNILTIGNQEILSIIRYPLKVRSGEIKGSMACPIHWLYIGTDGFLVLDSAWSAYDRITKFEAFRIEKDLSDIVSPSDPIISNDGSPEDDWEETQDDVIKNINDSLSGDIEAIQEKTDLITITQAVDLDDMESDIGTNTSSISGIQGILSVLKQTFQPKSDGSNTITKVVYDQAKTDGLEMSLSQTTAAFTSNSGNSILSITESSPGVFEVMVQDDAATPASIRAIYATASAGIPYVGIGTNSPSYTLDVSGRLNVSNSIFVQGNALNLNSLEYVNVTGATSGQVLEYNGTNWVPATISTGGIQDVVDDTTPQLGGDLDVNGKKIKSTTDVIIQVDSDNNSSLSKFIIQNGAGTQVFSVDEEGTKLSTTGADSDIKIGNLDGSLGAFNGISLNGDLTYPGIVGFAGGATTNDIFYMFGTSIDIRAGGATDSSVRIEETNGDARMVINSGFPIPTSHNLYVVGDGKFTGDLTIDGTISGVDLGDLDNVDTTTTAPTNGDALVWDNSAGKWVPDGTGGSGGGGSDSFNTIQVSGQSDVVADSGNDTLILAEGSNLEITTNATTDTITFGVSATPLFTSVATTSSLATLGTLSSTGNASIGGNISVVGTGTYTGLATYSTGLLTGKIEFLGGGTSVIAPATGLPNLPDDLEIRSNGNVVVVLDYDDNEASQSFEIKSGDGTTILKVDEDGVSSGLFTSVTPTISTIADFESTNGQTMTISNYDSNSQYAVTLFDSSNSPVSHTITNNSDGTFTIATGLTPATGYYIEVQAQKIGEFISATATSNTFECQAAQTQQRYWRLQMTDASKNPVNAKVAIGNFRLYTATGGGGTAYPSNMTSNTAPTPYVATAGYRYSTTYDYWRAFDANIGAAGSMYWSLGCSVASTNWIQIDLGSSIDFGSGECQIRTSGGWTDANYAVLYGSNTGDFTGEEREMAFFQNIDKAGESGGTFTTYTQAIT